MHMQENIYLVPGKRKNTIKTNHTLIEQELDISRSLQILFVRSIKRSTKLTADVILTYNFLKQKNKHVLRTTHL